MTAPTLAETLTALAALGIEGPAARLVDAARGGPLQRHKARIAAVMAAAMRWLDGDLLTLHSDPQGLTAKYALMAWWVLTLDIGGIGGDNGLGGNSTARHPAFRDCGKGRKNATDGAAWSAAIRDARASLEVALVERLGLPLGTTPRAEVFSGGDVCVRITIGQEDVVMSPLLAEIPWWLAASGRQLVAAADECEPDAARLSSLSKVYNQLSEDAQRWGTVSAWGRAIYARSGQCCLGDAELCQGEPPIEWRLSKAIEGFLDTVTLRTVMAHKEKTLEEVWGLLDEPHRKDLLEALSTVNVEFTPPDAPPAVEERADD